MIGQALVRMAPVLLLDEPLEDLDAAGIEAVARTVRSWCTAGGSVLAAAPDADRLPEMDRFVRISGTTSS